MFDFLYVIIGWIMKLCYSISFNNYIITLFIFALVMQVILFPFGIKQQKSSVKLASIRPKEMAIREKYRGRNDRATQQKMQTEIQQMYQAEGYSPTAGCLPLLVQMPIIFALFGVVRMPLSYTTNMDNANVGANKYTMYSFFEEAYTIAGNQADAYEMKMSTLEEGSAEYKYCEERIKYLIGTKKEDDKKDTGITDLITDANAATFSELDLIKFMQQDVDTFMKDFDYKDGKYSVSVATDVSGELLSGITVDSISGESFADKIVYKEYVLNASGGGKVYDFNAMLEEKGIYNPKEDKEVKNGAHCLPDFEFIGGTTTLDAPGFSLTWLLLVPVLVFLSSFFSAELSRKFTTQPVVAEGQPNPNGGFMRWMMPLMSTYFAVTLPAAIGIYWVFRSIASVGQQYILSKMYPAPVYTEADMRQAVKDVKQAKKRKKIVTIEVDEDDTSYDSLAISEERAEKIRRRKEKLEKEESENAKKPEEKSTLVEKPTLKDE
ncbi:MAG: membrane protein insertase YidC [Ruminococcaceae bacterium]|nr:membrane protein insertase YidC [Oscillospiraceae bacterium]